MCTIRCSLTQLCVQVDLRTCGSVVKHNTTTWSYTKRNFTVNFALQTFFQWATILHLWVTIAIITLVGGINFPYFVYFHFFGFVGFVIILMTFMRSFGPHQHWYMLDMGGVYLQSIYCKCIIACQCGRLKWIWMSTMFYTTTHLST